MTERQIALNGEQATSGDGGCWGNTPCKTPQIAQRPHQRPYDHLFKLLLLGDSGAGKSCLLLRFAEDIFPQGYICTIGIDFKIRTIEMDGKTIKLQIWDTAGGERFHTIVRAYYRGSHGILLAYDTTNQKSFSHAFDRWLPGIQEDASESCITMLVGTKCDLKDERVVEYEAAKELADQHGLLFFETSSKESINVEEAFITLVAKIKARLP